MNLFGNKWKDQHNPKGVSLKSFNLKSYVKVYKNAIPKQTMNGLLKILQKDDKWQKHVFHDNISDKVTTYDDDLDVIYAEQLQGDLKSYWDSLMKQTWRSIKQYHGDLDMFWYNGWKGYSPIRFNKYSPGEKMKVHCDHIHTIFDGSVRGIPIMSIVGCLNDDYKGGEFIMWEKEKIEIPAGSILIFPSNFLYPHKVMPIKSGHRYSFVSWVY